MKNLFLVDSNIEESETSGTDLWSPASIESSGTRSTSSFDFSISNSPLASELESNHDSTSTRNVFIDEKYLILGDKLGKRITYYF
jgi:hypothetical protein